MRAPIVLAALLTCAMHVALGRPAPASTARANVPFAQEPDPVEQLRRWTQRLAKKPEELSPEAEAKLREVLADVRLLQVAQSDRRHEVVLALLDLAALSPAPKPESPPETSSRKRGGVRNEIPDTALERITRTARAALAAMVAADRGDLPVWIGTSVLALPKVHPLSRRLVAIEVLAWKHAPESMLALFTCVREGEREARDAAIEALVGWSDESVHRFMLQQLEKSRDDAGWITAGNVRRHFALAAPLPGGDASRMLAEFASHEILDSNWREALRGLSMVRALSDDACMPALIEAFAVWCMRAQRGEGSRRVEGALLAELQRRTGRSFGPSPERWAAWWRGVLSGKFERGPSTQPDQSTHVGFFGLTPLTDRVVFVLDRSGSMDTAFGADGETRWDEAVKQMLHYLRALGPRTRFRVVLFSSELDVWHAGLKPATEENLDAVASWLRSKHPDGGTELRPAIEHVFRLGSDRTADVAHIEEDTVVVLCDGATAEGPQWVAPLLARVNDDACLVFHAVQIGEGGDGTLELLAEDSGGEFARVSH